MRHPIAYSTAAFLMMLAVAPRMSFAADASPEDVAFFESKVRPLLANHCYECHSIQTKKSKGGLRLDTRDGLLKGGDSGPALIPGDPAKSLLARAVRYEDAELRMPPKQKLGAAQIADLEAWIRKGAVDPRTSGTSAPKVATSGMSLAEARTFWSFRPVVDPTVPQVKNAAWPRTPVDNFVLARLEKAGIAPADDAERRVLLRRVSYDLTGLPPTPAEMDAFLADTSANAFEKVVDRLLASPRYGERWGRHWLDVVRYADTCGNASDYPVPQAYKYRDWVIEAFTRDLPYDQFVREQIAGDLMPSANEAEHRRRITATGYLAIAKRFGGGRVGEPHLTLEDTIDNLGRAVLGTSLACARCHDHKFDPFTMSDYYGIYGIFDSTRFPFPGAEGATRQEDFVPLMSQAEIDALRKPWEAKLAAINAEVKELETAEARLKKEAASADKKARLAEAAKKLAGAKKRRAELQAQTPVVDAAYAVKDAKPTNARMHVRGDPKRLGDEVNRHFPVVLGGQELPKTFKESGRLELAQWLTDPKNPLTARVMVNRIWQHHFGKGIVHTPNDFGRQGKAPTHPELLDFLAARFIESGWSVKAMHKLILLSHTWQLTSTPASGGRQSPGDSIDAGNELLWKHPRRRLDAEAIRDTILCVSGNLDETPGGPHPFPPQHTWSWTQHNPFVANYETRHRSVYLMQQRIRRNIYLALFDGADPSSSTGERLLSTTPLQALFLMNDSFVHKEASDFARRIFDAAKGDGPRLDVAYRLALSRTPSAEEREECLDFLRRYRERLTALKTPPAQAELAAWSAFVRSLLDSNEFIFVD